MRNQGERLGSVEAARTVLLVAAIHQLLLRIVTCLSFCIACHVKASENSPKTPVFFLKQVSIAAIFAKATHEPSFKI